MKQLQEEGRIVKKRMLKGNAAHSETRNNKKQGQKTIPESVLPRLLQLQQRRRD